MYSWFFRDDHNCGPYSPWFAYSYPVIYTVWGVHVQDRTEKEKQETCHYGPEVYKNCTFCWDILIELSHAGTSDHIIII